MPRDSILFKDFRSEEEIAKDDKAMAAEALGDNLAVVWQGKYLQWKQEKQRIYEEDWIDDMRAAHSMYEDAVDSEIRKEDSNKSKAYIGITRTKCIIAYSRLIELEFPGPSQKNWSVRPTPVPKLAPALKREVAERLSVHIGRLREQRAMQEQQAATQGKTAQLPPISEADLKDTAFLMVRKEAEEAAARMEARIEDQLVDAQYERKFRRAELERVQCGSFCMKGPLTRVIRRRQWIKTNITNESGEIAADWVNQDAEAEEASPDIEYVSIFDVFPDDQATEITPDTEICQRHVMDKAQLLGLIDYPGFNADKIAQVLLETPDGNYTPQHIEMERRQVATGQSTLSKGLNPRWEVVECHGMATGQDLLDHGWRNFEETDDMTGDEIEQYRKQQILSDYACELWICGHHVFKLKVLPGPRRYNLYMIVPYVEVPNQIWGIGVPRMMKTSREMINDAARAMINNAGEAERPYVEKIADLFDPGEQTTDKKEFIRDAVMDMAYPAIRFTNVPSIIAECLKIIELGVHMADAETTLPTIDPMALGPGAAHRTLGGLSMLMGGSLIILKAAVKNADDYFRKPLIERLYNFNMEYSSDNSIKGDMQVEAYGVAQLMAKEAQVPNILQFMQAAANPVIQHRVNWNDLLRDFATALDLDPRRVVLEDERITAAERDPLKMAQVHLQMQMVQKQIEEAESRIVQNLAKAKSLGKPDKQLMAEVMKAFEEVRKLRAEVTRILAEAQESMVNARIKEFGVYYDKQKLMQEAFGLLHNIQHDQRMEKIENTKLIGMQDSMRSTNPR